MNAPRLEALSVAVLLTLSCCGIQFSNAQPAGRADDGMITFVYIHGFGGEKQSPQFCDNIREFIATTNNRSRVVNYRWDSIKVDPLRAGASWRSSQKRADKEAGRFRREIIDKLEAGQDPYVLVGFSVGSRVIMGALEDIDLPLRNLQGVYFLGSAMTRDTTLTDRSALPKGMRIINYHSPLRDTVHSAAFNFMSEIPAGGQVGFDDHAVFENRRVSCSHAHKGIGIHIDYSGLAEPIASLELYRTGVRIPGKTKLNIVMPVGEGSVWWNKVLSVEVLRGIGRGRFEIEQHNMRYGYFRAVRVGEDGKRTRVARGENLHAILEQLGIERPGKARGTGPA
ncbi:MAG: DUF726 domain-containing protein [Verrucomicrobiaceae bacterium]|nr:DUF726 domain-containing protein [Verrucomicrobiaceae bacterium]